MKYITSQRKEKKEGGKEKKNKKEPKQMIYSIQFKMMRGNKGISITKSMIIA